MLLTTEFGFLPSNSPSESYKIIYLLVKYAPGGESYRRMQTKNNLYESEAAGVRIEILFECLNI